MLLNKVLFPAPKPPHYTAESHRHSLFWLPAESSSDSPIPCMFYSPQYSTKPIENFIIFCHGNGCDIGSMQGTLNTFSRQLNVYIISFEYPSYGLCTAKSPNQQTINAHADRTFKFVRDTLKWPTERIIIYGHSIGSGAACYLASTQTNIGALILQSPYTAINTLVREKVGVLSYLVGSRSWDNLESMKHIKCSVLFIHGLADTLIPSKHSDDLHTACANAGKKLVLLRHEDHNSMTDETLLKYIKPFLEKQCKLADPNLYLPIVKIDDNLRRQSQNIPSDDINTNSSSGIFSSLFAMSKASTAATMSSIQKISGRKQTDDNQN